MQELGGQRLPLEIFNAAVNIPDHRSTAGGQAFVWWAHQLEQFTVLLIHPLDALLAKEQPIIRWQFNKETLDWFVLEKNPEIQR